MTIAAGLVFAAGAYVVFGPGMPDIRWPGGDADRLPPEDLQQTFELADGPVVYLPAGFLPEGQEIHIAEHASPPPPPDGESFVGPVFDITAPSDFEFMEGGFVVRLPLPDPSVVDDDDVQVYIGHYKQGSWAMLPAHVEDGMASAVVSDFSPFSVFILPRRGTITAAELPRVVVDPPRISAFTVRGDMVYANMDVSPSRTARVSGNYRGVKVQRLRVYVSKPTPNGFPYRRDDAFVPYQRFGEDVYLEAGYSFNMLQLDFDPDGTMPIGSYDGWSSKPFWFFKVAPIFKNGMEGPMSAMVRIEVGAAEAVWRMRRGILARLTPDQATEFEQLTWDNPVTILTHRGSTTADLYHPARASRLNRVQSMLFTGQLRNFIGLSSTATYVGVVTHEWGHFATHTIYGDDAFMRLPGGSHNGWREADSRGLVWSEDLATWLGQWGTEKGVPASAGAMRGRWTDASRDPAGEDNSATAWPNNTDMDATRVEMVWATILSRLTRSVGFSRMYSFMRTTPVVDGIRFTNAWFNQSNEDMAELQPILLEEGIAWKFRGRVVGQTEDDEPEPLEGVAVILQTLSGDKDLYPGVVGEPIPIYTDRDGYFETLAPPGTVHIALEKSGWQADTYHTFYADTRGPTNGEAQIVKDDLLMVPNQLPTVTITSPSSGDVITERVVTVIGTVEGTLDGTADTGPITTARMRVGSESYDLAVRDGSFSQEVVLAPGGVTITVTAQNAGGEASESVAVQAAIEATILKVILTWSGSSTDVDLWVTDPEGTITSFQSRTPAEGRELDIDDTDGLGPETYTMSLPLRGTYNVRVNYFRGEGGESFRLRWVVWEGTERETRGNRSGSLSEADGNGGTPSANRSFTIEVR